MILKLLQVINEADDLIRKYRKDRNLIIEIKEDFRSIDQMIERNIESDHTSHTTK